MNWTMEVVGAGLMSGYRIEGDSANELREELRLGRFPAPIASEHLLIRDPDGRAVMRFDGDEGWRSKWRELDD